MKNRSRIGWPFCWNNCDSLWVLFPRRCSNAGWISLLSQSSPSKTTLTVSFSCKRLRRSSAEANRLNKSQWAGANRRTLLPSCTNSICWAVWGCAWPALPFFNLPTCPLAIWAIMKFPASQVSSVDTLPDSQSSVQLSVCAINMQNGTYGAFV